MFFNKKYLYRHKILSALQQQQDEKWHPNCFQEDIELSYQELLEKSGLTEKQFLRQVDYLDLEKEISISEKDFNIRYMILKKGTSVFHDKKHIREGWNAFLTSVYDLGKTLSVYVLLGIAIVTYFSNRVAIEKNKVDIELMKKNIQILNERMNKTNK